MLKFIKLFVVFDQCETVFNDPPSSFIEFVTLIWIFYSTLGGYEILTTALKQNSWWRAWIASLTFYNPSISWVT